MHIHLTNTQTSTFIWLEKMKPDKTQVRPMADMTETQKLLCLR